MKRSSLAVLNIGLLIIMFSAFGTDMQIDYSILTTGVFIAFVGAVMFLRSRKK